MKNWVKYLLIVLFILVLITIISKTRTAILVFGQPRTYKKCYQSLFDNIIKQNNHNFDIYLITWKKDYDKELLKYYKPKDVLLLDYDDFLKDLEGINKLKIGLYQPSKHLYKNTYYIQLWQWYKGYEFIKNKNYDYIVKTRFDIQIKKPIKINNNNYFIDLSERLNRYENNIAFDDIFFIVTKNDSEIFELWNKLGNLNFINKDYLLKYKLIQDKNWNFLILENLITIYVKDYKKYDYEILDEGTIKLIR